MSEFASTRHNPLIDPQLAVWSWEIPVYLFVGGAVAGLMIMGGSAMWRRARGEDPERFFSMQAPLLAIMLLNVGMLALLLDLSHKLYVWRIYLTFQPTAPMSWGSWVLLAVYAVLVLSMLVRLPQAWPWLGERVPWLQRVSGAVDGKTRWLALANIVLGLGLGTYTGLLLNTMVARPLWNSAMLPLLFLFSGLCAGSALLIVAARLRGEGPAPRGPIGGALAALVQPLGDRPPPAATHDSLVRANIAFLAIELALIGLFVANLATGTASHSAALALLTSGAYARSFWGIDVLLCIVLPIVVQVLALAGRMPRSVIPALLVVAGSFTLRWVMVNAGQASALVAGAP